MPLVSGDAVGVIALFSTLGFVIFGALPTITIAAWNVLTTTRHIEILRLKYFHVRFVGMFIERKVFYSFAFSSIVSLIAGLLCLFYCLLSSEYALCSALVLEITAIIVVLITLIYIVTASCFPFKKDVEKVLEYIPLSEFT